MSSDIRLSAMRKTKVFDYNITHNLSKMANEAGIYEYLRRPEDKGVKVAGQLIEPLTNGLALLKSEPDRFIRFNPTNGWGNYGGLVQFVEKYLEACNNNPDASISISR